MENPSGIPSPFLPRDVPPALTKEQVLGISKILGDPKSFLLVVMGHEGVCNPALQECDGHNIVVQANGMTPEKVHGLFHGMLDDFHRQHGNEHGN